eukprot:453506_1
MHICFAVVLRLQKKNEEAFIRAIDIAKQQFGHACGAWLDRVNKLLPQSQQIRVKKKKRAHRTPQDQPPVPSVTYTYPPAQSSLKRQISDHQMELPRQENFNSPITSART